MDLKLQNHIPNALTLLNLLSGCVAIVFAFMGRLDIVPYCVAISLVADFTDGLFARALKSTSLIGADLDSLADMVSFGALPGIILFLLIDQKMEGVMMVHQDINIIAILGFSVTIFSAMRLAKFNVDDTQTEEFIGLATPASTLFVVGILLIEKRFQINFLPIHYLFVSGMLSYLLISKLKMFSFKMKGFQWKQASWQYIFIALSFIALFWLKAASLSVIIVIYILLNVLRALFSSKHSLAKTE